MNILTRILGMVVLAVSALHAQTWETFDLRAAPFFATRSINIDDGGGSGSQYVGDFSLVVDNNTSPPEVYGSASVSIDTSASAQSWAIEVNGWTATIDASTLQDAVTNGYVLWPSLERPSPPVQDVLLPADRMEHTLVLAQQDGSDPIVETTISIGDWIDGSWIFASASFDPALPFWVKDLTTGERSETNATYLENWSEDNDPGPLREVTFVLDTVEAGNRFTLHYQVPGQSEMVESILAALDPALGYEQMGNGNWLDVSGKAFVTGSVAVGGDYWITRDGDEWDSRSYFSWNYSPNASYPSPLLWSLLELLPELPSPWQTTNFYIATGYGAMAYVNQPSGIRELTYVSSGMVEDYDSNGNSHDFEYEKWTAEINTTEPFWLNANSTELSQGEVWFYNGWEAIGGTGPNWQTIYFHIATGYGSSATVSQFGTSNSLTDTGETGSIPDEDTNGFDHSFYYERWSAWLDANAPFTLTAGATELAVGETWFYNGWYPIGGSQESLVEFQIAVGFGSVATLTQGGGLIDLTNTGETGVVVDTDGYGQDHSFHYERWTAWMNNEPFVLSINGTPLAEGETWFYNGWTPIGPGEISISLTLHESRTGRNFLITAPNGNSWEWEVGSWSGLQTVEFETDWLEPQPWQMDISVGGASRTFAHADATGEWTLTDLTTGQTATFDPNGATEYALNLGHWFEPAAEFPLYISLSRWGHDLRIRQRNGEEYSVTPGASQGDLTLLNGSTWYQSYYNFAATGHRRIISGLDWRVVDMTTGEESPISETNLINWISLFPPQDLQSERTGLDVVQLEWHIPEFEDPDGHQGGGFYIERKADGGEWVEVDNVDAASIEDPAHPGTFRWQNEGVPTGSTYRYRVAYFYGDRRSAWATGEEVPVMVDDDTDNDGMSDQWELDYGFNPVVADASGDADNDGYTNLEEYLMETDPQRETVRITVTAPTGAYFVAGNTQP